MYEVIQRINIFVTDVPTPPATGVLSSTGSFVAEDQAPILLIGVVATLLILAFFLFRKRSVRKMNRVRLGIGSVAVVLLSIFTLNLAAPTRADSMLTLDHDTLNVTIIKPELSTSISSTLNIADSFQHIHTATLDSISDDRISISLNGNALYINDPATIAAESIAISHGLSLNVTITNDLPLGEYYAYITHTVADTSSPSILYIQEVNDMNCPTERTMAVDARDYRTYWVQRMPDGRCWMLTNLAYAGGGSNQFGDVVTDLVDNIVNNNSLTNPNFGRPAGANPTTYPTAPSTSTTGIGQYGYLYNWCAAMGNQQGTAACMSAQTPLPDPSVSICPAGWRLPTGIVSTGEFVQLNNAVNSGLLNSDLGLRTQWLGMYGGNWMDGSFGFVGTRGNYWSSTLSYGSARFFNFHESFASPYNGTNRWRGLSVRCIAM